MCEPWFLFQRKKTLTVFCMEILDTQAFLSSFSKVRESNRTWGNPFGEVSCFCGDCLLLLGHCRNCEMYTFSFFSRKDKWGFWFRNNKKLLTRKNWKEFTSSQISRQLGPDPFPPLMYAVCSCVPPLPPLCPLAPAGLSRTFTALSPHPCSSQRPASAADQTLHPTYVLSQHPAFHSSFVYRNYSFVNESLNVYLPR